jgi:hypothetical protein
MYKLWVNVDTDGNIIDAYGGYETVVGEPLQEYTYYFEVTDTIFKSKHNYKVVNGELVLK